MKINTHLIVQGLNFLFFIFLILTINTYNLYIKKNLFTMSQFSLYDQKL